MCAPPPNTQPAT
ncbi:hypothetical protein GMOD_00006281 [Pyrenophora seminiperda CCB06]|uniref:Uncharacterized protein n=1 Tax=Pyrenophora seminiperda CCB06 TaxID=1302712 RepID=A0A3M7M4R7_9PLEO|nr:hypothetical protein GMOD_00006281 [Pyrenophora seminiperda CCB06]